MRNVVYGASGSARRRRVESMRPNSCTPSTAGCVRDMSLKRNSFTTTVATLVVAVALTASSALAQRAELDKIIKRRVLANGLEVIVVENHGVPLATVEIDVKNGSFTQSPEYAGLAH